MDSKKLLILLVVLIWITAALTYVVYKGYYKERIVGEFWMDITVTDEEYVGINVDIDAIHFGVVPLGGGSERHINLSNSKEHDVFIYLTKDDSKLSSIVTIEPNYFILKASEKKNIDVRSNVPEELEPGNYTGKLKVIERRASFFDG